MQRVISYFLLMVAVGCSPQPKTAQIPSGAPSVVLTDMRRDGDPSLSAKDRAAVAAARQYLERTRRRPLDAYYSVKRTDVGYDVFVEYVAGYEGTQPLFVPGGHGIVELKDDGTFIRYLPGE